MNEKPIMRVSLASSGPAASWITHFSTVLGAVLALPPIGLMIAHQMPWQQGVPLAVAGIVGIVWPKGASVYGPAVANVVTDLEPFAEAIVQQLEAKYAVVATPPNNAVTPSIPASVTLIPRRSRLEG